MKKETIYVLNGPNLNLLGLREPKIYGHDVMLNIEELCRKTAEDNFFSIFFLQSNQEGILVDYIQEAREQAVAIVINPAAYGHTSIAILDALNSFEKPVAEVHISNIYQRELFRHHSYISCRADCVIAGCGILGYRFALEFVIKKYLNNRET